MKLLTRQEELILLTVLHLKEQAYLVTIRKHLNALTGKNLSVGAIYVPLNRLEKMEFLETRIGEPNAKRGRNQIKYFSLTQKAMDALAEIKKVNDELWPGYVQLTEGL